MFAAADRTFPRERFLTDALDGYDALELMGRARHIARAMTRALPDDYERAIDILIRSLGSKTEGTDRVGMGPFLYLPHVFFVADNGLDHFEASMRAQYELTQRFTAEFSIRRFLEHDPSRTLARLERWTRDPSPHVRRLVSEGTRPRLPWAPRLREFQKDPTPVLALLELLKDDESLYVRRSVANNLNDIGKDHPKRLVAACRRWARGATPERRWLIRHALRSAVKRGDSGALAVLGFGRGDGIAVRNAACTPARVAVGRSVTFGFDLVNPTGRTRTLLVDARVHFVKARGKTSPKVFKLKAVTLAPRGRVRLEKTLSFRAMTTRTHYPGRHVIEVLVNGKSYRAAVFELVTGRGAAVRS